MKREDRKAAVDAYKERKVYAGIYAVHCAATGKAWVGRSLDIGAIQNRQWFALRLGKHTVTALQSAWNAHGEGNFSCEALERLEPGDPDYARDAKLKERLAHWRGRLNAGMI